jgi:hypothetical protein
MWPSEIEKTVTDEVGKEKWTTLQQKVRTEHEINDVGGLDKNATFVRLVLAQAWEDGIKIPSLEKLCVAILDFAKAHSKSPVGLEVLDTRFAQSRACADVANLVYGTSIQPPPQKPSGAATIPGKAALKSAAGSAMKKNCLSCWFWRLLLGSGVSKDWQVKRQTLVFGSWRKTGLWFAIVKKGIMNVRPRQNERQAKKMNVLRGAEQQAYEENERRSPNLRLETERC